MFKPFIRVRAEESTFSVSKKPKKNGKHHVLRESSCLHKNLITLLYVKAIIIAMELYAPRSMDMENIIC